ncbi:MAG: hypothetical protein M1168_03000 [Candidatus Marsarchaeota archaeon]|nr:hypothetical protein [Candidatus Marsarchaeota archaeon]
MSDLMDNIFGSGQAEKKSSDDEDFSSTQIKIITAGFGRSWKQHCKQAA